MKRKLVSGLDSDSDSDGALDGGAVQSYSRRQGGIGPRPIQSTVLSSDGSNVKPVNSTLLRGLDSDSDDDAEPEIDGQSGAQNALCSIYDQETESEGSGDDSDRLTDDAGDIMTRARATQAVAEDIVDLLTSDDDDDNDDDHGNHPDGTDDSRGPIGPSTRPSGADIAPGGNEDDDGPVMPARRRQASTSPSVIAIVDSMEADQAGHGGSLSPSALGSSGKPRSASKRRLTLRAIVSTVRLRQQSLSQSMDTGSDSDFAGHGTGSGDDVDELRGDEGILEGDDGSGIDDDDDFGRGKGSASIKASASCRSSGAAAASLRAGSARATGTRSGQGTSGGNLVDFSAVYDERDADYGRRPRRQSSLLREAAAAPKRQASASSRRSGTSAILIDDDDDDDIDDEDGRDGGGDGGGSEGDSSIDIGLFDVEESDGDDDECGGGAGGGGAHDRDRFRSPPRAGAAASSANGDPQPAVAPAWRGFPDPHLPFFKPVQLLSALSLAGKEAVHVNYCAQFRGAAALVAVDRATGLVTDSRKGGGMPSPELKRQLADRRRARDADAARREAGSGRGSRRKGGGGKKRRASSSGGSAGAARAPGGAGAMPWASKHAQKLAAQGIYTFPSSAAAAPGGQAGPARALPFGSGFNANNSSSSSSAAGRMGLGGSSQRGVEGSGGSIRAMPIPPRQVAAPTRPHPGLSLTTSGSVARVAQEWGR